MGVTILFSLEPIDEQDPSAGYRPVLRPRGMKDQRQLAEAIIEAGLPTDVETILALFEAEQAAVASLLREGWDVTVWGGTLETPWPDLEQMTLLGGTTTGRPMVGQERVIQRMIEHGAPHTRSQIEALYAALDKVATNWLLDGYQIELPSIMMTTGIAGRFDKPDDEYDPERHEITVEGEPLQEITDWLEGYREMERRELDGPPRPLLDGYDDVNTRQSDGQLSPGHMVRLRGYWLRFRYTDPRQGVFFVAEDGTTIREDAVAFDGLNMIVFTLRRDLPPGAYWLEVRTVILPCDGLQRATLPHSISIVAADDAPEEKGQG